MALSDYALFIAYFAIGIAVYSKLEGWSPLDATYFMMTVSTTVGYGDLAPASADGRLFTCVYALLGTTVIISALSPAVAWALGLLRSYYDRVVPLLVDTEDYTLSLKELNQRISYPRRYLRALLGPALLMLVGVLHGIYGGGLGVLDACYFSIITMTTVGFGDLTPTSDADKAFALLYLPLAVTALADALSEIESIKMRRKIRETDHLASPDKLLLAKAAKTRNSNGSFRGAKNFFAPSQDRTSLHAHALFLFRCRPCLSPPLPRSPPSVASFRSPPPPARPSSRWASLTASRTPSAVRAATTISRLSLPTA